MFFRSSSSNVQSSREKRGDLGPLGADNIVNIRSQLIPQGESILNRHAYQALFNFTSLNHYYYSLRRTPQLWKVVLKKIYALFYLDQNLLDLAEERKYRKEYFGPDLDDSYRQMVMWLLDKLEKIEPLWKKYDLVKLKISPGLVAEAQELLSNIRCISSQSEPEKYVSPIVLTLHFKALKINLFFNQAERDKALKINLFFNQVERDSEKKKNTETAIEGELEYIRTKIKASESFKKEGMLLFSRMYYPNNIVNNELLAKTISTIYGIEEEISWSDVIFSKGLVCEVGILDKIVKILDKIVTSPRSFTYEYEIRQRLTLIFGVSSENFKNFSFIEKIEALCYSSSLSRIITKSADIQNIITKYPNFFNLCKLNCIEDYVNIFLDSPYFDLIYTFLDSYKNEKDRNCDSNELFEIIAKFPGVFSKLFEYGVVSLDDPWNYSSASASKYARIYPVLIEVLNRNNQFFDGWNEEQWKNLFETCKEVSFTKALENLLKIIPLTLTPEQFTRLCIQPATQCSDIQNLLKGTSSDEEALTKLKRAFPEAFTQKRKTTPLSQEDFFYQRKKCVKRAKGGSINEKMKSMPDKCGRLFAALPSAPPITQTNINSNEERSEEPQARKNKLSKRK